MRALDMQGEAVRASAVLNEGAVYSRADLAELFAISDMTLNTGIFQPKGHASVWLFVTEHKTPDRTQYVDRLEGDTLRWQGQSSGRKDHLIREHRIRDLELLLFYRHAKKEFDNYGFRYEGVFDYVSDEGRNPASFILRRRVPDVLSVAQARVEEEGVFNPQGVEDARARVLTSIVRRRGQGAFRQQLLSAYGGKCAITGCDVMDVLEAAHIVPYQGDATNVVSNGLLLRADIHTLFDLGKIAIDPNNLVVSVCPELHSGEYGYLHAQQIRLPTDQHLRPSRDALAWHRANIANF